MDDARHNRDGPGGTPPPPTVGEGGHLDPETLNALLDGELTAEPRAAAEAHLAGCASCRADLAELRATVLLLRGLPEPRPRRSFQLGPEHARAGRGDRPGWLERLLPSLPALRAATIGVAVLLVAVTAGDLLTDQGETVQTPSISRATATTTIEIEAAPETEGIAPAEEDGAAFKAPPSQTRDAARGAPAGATDSTRPDANGAAFGEGGDAPPAPPTSDGDDGSGGAEDAALPQSEPETESIQAAAPLQATESAVQGEPAAGAAGGADAPDQVLAAEEAAADDTTMMVAADEAAASPAPPVTPPPTAAPPPSPTPTATATPTAIPTTAPTAGEDDGPSGWRIAQVALALALAWLGVTVIGLERLRRR